MKIVGLIHNKANKEAKIVSKTRLNLIKTFSVIFAVCMGIVISTMPATAEGDSNFSMSQSAQIRNSESDSYIGLQFTSTVNEAWLAENSAGTYTFGTLIYPTAKADSFDITKSIDDNIELVDAANIVHVANQSVTAGATFNASIIFDENVVSQKIVNEGKEVTNELVDSVLKNLYNKDFTARSYAIVNGETTYTENSYSTSMYKVAATTYAKGESESNQSDKDLALNYFDSASVKTATIGYVGGALTVEGYTATDSTIVIIGNDQLDKKTDYTIDGGQIVFTKEISNSETIFLIDNGVLTVLNATYANDEVKSVAEALALEENSKVIVNGYYVGMANLAATSVDEDLNCTATQLLIKDKDSDKIIGVRKVFGSYEASTAGWNYRKQYDYGDEVCIRGTVLSDSFAGNQKYIEYSNYNPEKSETIKSRDNAVTYKFEDAIVLESSDVWESTFTTEDTGIKPMTLVKFTGTVLGARNYEALNADPSTLRAPTRTNRLHYNTSAGSFSAIRISGRYVSLLDNLLTANIGNTSWKDKIPWKSETATSWDSTSKESIEVNFYAMYVGSNANNWEIVILQEWWLDAHEHVYDDGEEIATCTVEGCTYKHVHSYSGDWQIETLPTPTTDGLEYRECTIEGCSKREERITKVEFTSIEITTLPTKTEYFVYETFDKTGMVVTGYFANGDSQDITSLVTVEEKVLSLGENQVTVSYGELTQTITVTAKANDVSDVSYNLQENTEVMVTGYFVGVANEGDSADKEMLIKDINTDDIIAIRNVPYDTLDNNFGYTYGDEVIISATLKIETDTETLGKRYLDFSDKNGDINSTILSNGNAVNFSLENTLDFYQDTSYEDDYWLSEIFHRDSNFYKIVKIQGCIYGFRHGDTDNLVIHFNANYQNNAHQYFLSNSGGKLITLRGDANSQNVGDDWLEYFGGDLIGSNPTSSKVKSYAGYAVLVDMYAVYTGGDADTYQLTVLSKDWLNSTDTVVDGEYSNEEVLKEVVLAYFRQGGQFQYNQTMVRRNINASPEDASAQRQLYLDCSSFANTVIHEAFGMNIILDDNDPYKTGSSTFEGWYPQTYNIQLFCERFLNIDPAVKAVWKESDDYKTSAKKAELIAYLSENIQPGDVIDYRGADGSGSTGHVIVYLGNDTFFHSQGTDFIEVGDTVDGVKIEHPAHTRDASYRYEKSSTVVFRNKMSFISWIFNSRGVVCWIRPFDRVNVTPTSNSLARMQYQGLITEKVVDKGINSSVQKGDEITYTISATNHSRIDYKEILVKEILDSDVTLVSAPSGYELNGNTLTFKFDLDKLSSTEFSYTVKVKDTAEAGALIESEQTTVGGILTTRVFNVVSGYTSTQLEEIANKAIGYANSGTTFDNPMDLIQNLYSDVTAFEGYDTVSELLADLLDVDVNDEIVEDCSLSSMVAPDLYGGRHMTYMYVRDKDNVRLIKECNLSVGDVIVADYRTAQTDDDGNAVTDPDTSFTVYDDVYYVIYVYVGNRQLVAYSNEPAVYSSEPAEVDSTTLNTCKLKTMIDGQTKYDNILVTLFSYSRYAVLRPSMVA